MQPERAFPSDWPLQGAIDLKSQDLPHASSTIEWWYVNSHLRAVDGREYSLFAAFFRSERDGGRGHSHFLTWALTDVAEQIYYPQSLLDPSTPQEALKELEQGKGAMDPRIRGALREIFERGGVPRPDRLLQREAILATDGLAIDLDGNRFVRESDGGYLLELHNDELGLGCQLRFIPQKPAIRNGDDGVVNGFTAKQMFYYFVPRCQVEGKLGVGGKDIPLQSATGWYDHEFGRSKSGSDAEEKDVAWNWVSAQLDNGWDLTAYETIELSQDQQVPLERRLVLIDPHGARQVYATFELQPLAYWTSTRTFSEYPVRWRLLVPEVKLDLMIESEFAGQEFQTLLNGPGFWEGRVRVRGEHGGQAVRGLGFVERTGFHHLDQLDQFFAAVGREMRRQVEDLFPLQPTAEQLCRMIASPELSHHMEGVDEDQLSRVLIQPIRDILDRGGKAWRSYGVLASMDVVGGDSHKFRHWLGLAELLHVGSLIVDDVEDRSEIRRGGPSCHKLHGEALAINAGSACYFLGLLPLRTDPLRPEQVARIYDAFFQALRAAHAGQALDIDGLQSLMPAVVESGDTRGLERRVLAIHRLKSAVPPGALARMSAEVAGGTAAQVTGLGHLFEAFGLAFQIMDDALNLRGFQRGLKSQGEDIAEGKITLPVAKAMARLAREQRRALWQAVAAKPREAGEIARIIDVVAACGALDECEAQAREIIETAWRRFDPLVDDSFAKVMLRAFGWFILDREY